MGWGTLEPKLRAIAERVCTPRELDALKLWAAGAGYRRIARMLDIAPTTARDRVQRALRKISQADTGEAGR